MSLCTLTLATPRWGQEEGGDFLKARGVTFKNQEHYKAGLGWFPWNDIPVRSYFHCNRACLCRAQEAERDRPFVHQGNLNGMAGAFADLLEVNNIHHDRNWLTMVEQPHFDVLRKASLAPDSMTRYRPPGADRDALVRTLLQQGTKYALHTYAQVVPRDLYIHVDAARIKGVPDNWTQSASVIKLRLSGLKQGINQLRLSLSPSPHPGIKK